MRHDSMVDAVGHTPVIRLRIDDAPDGVEVYAKMELQNLFAMKDRVARQVILEARRTGELAPGGPVVESSSGTMALGLALVGTALGHPVHIVTDPRIDPITLSKLRTLGCRVHIVEAMTGGGWQSARLERLARLMADLPGAFWPRQYTNPQNPAAYRTLATELAADLGSLDVLVGAVGSGGSLCGTSRALLERFPELRVVGVDCVGSVLFAQPDVPTRKQSGLGNSLYPGNIDYRLFDEVHWLSDDEAFAAAHALAREQKIFAGNTSGSVYRILTHLAKQSPPGTRLVGIMPDRGDRYVDSVYATETNEPVAAEPVEVPYGTTVTSWSFARIPRRDRKVLLFVESNTTGTGMLALRTAVRLGLEPVFLTADPARYAGLDDTAAQVVVCDTDDPKKLRAAAEQAVAGRTVAGVTTTSEYFLVQAATLATRLGVPGNDPAALRRCRNKALTRETLEKAGVAQPRFAVARTTSEVKAAVSLIGLPCVVKPVDDSGSHDVLWCPTAEIAVAHAARVLAVGENVRGQATAQTVLVEEFLSGPEFSAEMFCADGEALCVGLTERTVSPLPHFVETGHHFPAALDPADTAALAETARRALKATRFTQGPAHVELKLTPSGPAVIEINGRLAGGMIPELVRPATGVDLLEQQLRAASGMPLRLTADRTKHAGIRFLIAPRPGRFLEVSGVERARLVGGVEQVTVTGTPGRVVRPAWDAYDRLGFVIAVAPSAAEVERALDEAMAEMEVVISEE
ncbi:pyridoxal-phosphate dependent enzyme [Catenulispora subtropica]|uniref:ATP-grasp domain-containing protein n=1 Tax=Catenulispora subtropica TaxID=450798 RepID=A0ABP5ERK1_9ACTN